MTGIKPKRNETDVDRASRKKLRPNRWIEIKRKRPRLLTT